MVRRCERVVRSCIYSLSPFYTDGSGNVHPLRSSISIAKRDHRWCNDCRHRPHPLQIRLRLRFHRPRYFFVFSSSSVFAPQRERRGTVMLWSSTDVHRDLGWISVSVHRCRHVWEARRGQRGLVAKVGKRFIRPRELPNYTRSH